jgi:DMSO/TMAO reductase YedYZ molybdopterin-dependent catalytic subunit
MLNRRQVITSAGKAVVGIGAGLAFGPNLVAAAAQTASLPFANGDRELVAYPGKRKLLRLSTRPPQLETPFEVFNDGLITPNDAFFVRYHLADIPLEIDPETFTVEIKGTVAKPLSLTVQDLKTQFETVEVIAVHQCSGNSRGLFEPRIGGGQAGNGMMGNARWTGVRLSDVLAKAGVAKEAIQVSFNGLDGPVIPETPDFVKAMPIAHATDGEVLLAWAMNGEDLPWLNGYPLRLVVPGHYGTYWVKHLSEITVLDKEFEGFWYKKAYRIPDNACACTEPGKTAASTIPITRFDVRSFITSVLDGGKIKAGEAALRGIAFDGGYGITDVAVSADDGKTWRSASLGEDLGKYSFREWKLTMPLAAGEHTLMVRATNRIGQSQPLEPLWNPAGYMRNVVERTKIVAA